MSSKKLLIWWDGCLRLSVDDVVYPPLVELQIGSLRVGCVTHVALVSNVGVFADVVPLHLVSSGEHPMTLRAFVPTPPQL